MRKKIFQTILVLVFQGGYIFGQNETCVNSSPFCTGIPFTYPAGISGSAEPGAYYACLQTQPAPAWFHMVIENPGDVTIYMYSNPQVDIDFICWGPFTDPFGPCLEELTIGNVVDCSYSPNPAEFCDIEDGETGEFYIMMITNYSQQPTEITFEQSSGGGTLNCDIVTGFPDLVIENQLINPLSVCPGDSIFARCIVHNLGNADANQTFTRYYLSTDTLYSPEDIELGCDSVAILLSGEFASNFDTLFIPPGTPVNDYFVLFKADADNFLEESDENNNLDYSPVTVDTATGLTELNPRSLKIYPNPAGNVLYIDFSGIEEKPNSLEIINPSGNIVLKKEPGISGVDYISLDINMLDPGIYFVRLNFTTGSLSKIIQVTP